MITVEHADEEKNVRCEYATSCEKKLGVSIFTSVREMFCCKSGIVD